MDLPTGLVTFLLTDVEDSTRLWDSDALAMQADLARHDELIEDLVARHQGTLVRPRGEGDSRFAVFRTATDAVAAATAIQAAMAVEPWRVAKPLRLHMGVHTGEADLRAGDYYGSAVNRCARLRSLAQGGQILVSGATYDLVCDSLPGWPADSESRPLGEYHLTGLARVERVFQLRHLSIKEDFPALRQPGLPPNNLPARLNSFVGRRAELASLERLLLDTDVRLVTLTGSGGVGKTRLALEVARELVGAFSGGTHVVALDAVRDPQLVGATIAQVLGVRLSAGRDVTKLLIDAIEAKEQLLVLDNFEQLLDAAPLVGDLLRACPRLTVLATSREVLRLSAEHVWAVTPLSLRVDDESGTTHDSDAVQLFAERARAARSDFTLTVANFPTVVNICRAVDGLPLAIELVAARLRALPLTTLAAQLHRSRLGLLTTGARDGLPRHQALARTIAWSHDLLSSAEQVLFRRLAVFAGGCMLDSALAVCRDGGEPDEVLEALTSLVDKSLLNAVADASGESRFAMLETIREFALQQLEASGEQELVRQRHAAVSQQFAEQAGQQLRGSEQARWLSRLDADHDNLRACLAWAATTNADELGLALAAALWPFWRLRGYLNEGREWLRSFLERTASPDASAADALRARALEGAGVLAYMQDDNTHAEACHQASLALRRRLGDQLGIATCLSNLGATALSRGDYAGAQSLFEESLALRRAATDPFGLGRTLSNLGMAIWRRGDRRRAEAHLVEGLQVSRQCGDEAGTAFALRNLADLVAAQDQLERAEHLLEESLELHTKLGDKSGVAHSRLSLGDLARRKGAIVQALQAYQHSLVTYRALGNRSGITACLERLPGLASRAGRPAFAARVFGAAAVLRSTVEPQTAEQRERYGQDLELVRASLTVEEFATAWETGVREPLASAIDTALSLALPEVTEPQTVPAMSGGSSAGWDPSRGIPAARYG